MGSETLPEFRASQRVIAALSIAVIAAVAAVLYLFPASNIPKGGGPDSLATLNAALNTAASLFLVSGFVFIRRRNVSAHRACMLTAFVLSSIFLVTYLLHHARVGSVQFQGHGLIRTVYFAVLVPHVLLAAAIVPLALVTLRRGWIRDLARHRAIARVTLPLWLYVSTSGVLLYWMLYF